MKKTVITALMVVLLPVMVFCGRQAYDAGRAREEVSRVLVESHNVRELSRVRLKKLADLLTFGLYDGYEEFKAAQEKLLRAQEEYRRQAHLHTLCFGAAASLLLLCSLAATPRIRTIGISLAGLVALGYGLGTPILEMTIHKQVPYLGDVVLMTETRGVLGSILQLFNDHQYVVAGTLLLFSVLFPLLKSLAMLLVALFLRSTWARGLLRFFTILGKWSMADVFVVATFLVYLSAGRGEMSRAAVLPGFYFFLSYVLLSMFASLSADRMLKRTDPA
jgi:hypothetical protein